MIGCMTRVAGVLAIVTLTCSMAMATDVIVSVTSGGIGFLAFPREPLASVAGSNGACSAHAPTSILAMSGLSASAVFGLEYEIVVSLGECWGRGVLLRDDSGFERPFNADGRVFVRERPLG